MQITIKGAASFLQLTALALALGFDFCIWHWPGFWYSLASLFPTSLFFLGVRVSVVWCGVVWPTTTRLKRPAADRPGIF